MEIPLVGLGTYLSKDPSLLESTIIHAIENVGYRHIDTAAFYENEEAIGNALQKIFQKGVLKREDIFITTKLAHSDHRPERVEPAIQLSLKKLQLSYVDLYLIHFPIAHVPSEEISKPLLEDGKPIPDHVDILDTWKAMQEVNNKGLARKIGVSNFSIEMLERINFSPEVTVQPYTNQVEHNLYIQQIALIEYLETRNIFLTSYSPLGNQRQGPFWC